MTTAARSWSMQRMMGYAAYGLLGMPLAMAALPVYVQIPQYYTTHLGLDLALTGWILFCARLIDTIQDPWIGQWIDGLRSGLYNCLALAAGALAFAIFCLWSPPIRGAGLAVWLAVMLIIGYIAHSVLNITYLSWGARLQQTSADGLLGAAAWREGSGIVGVVIASVVPTLIMAKPHINIAYLMGWYSIGFALLLLVAMLALLYAAPIWQRIEVSRLDWRDSWHLIAQNESFKKLLPAYFLNALSVSIPATLVLFFINDRLQAPNYAGAFLVSYFLAAAVGLPIWVYLAKSIGILRSWRFGMLLAILAFCSAILLHEGDTTAFFGICLTSGFTLGADLALPPVLLAKIIRPDEPPAAYYGIWTLLSKLALALSGLALPLLAFFNYQPGHPSGELLAWVYAGIPCVFKCAALILLVRLQLDEEVAHV